MPHRRRPHFSTFHHPSARAQRAPNKLGPRERERERRPRDAEEIGTVTEAAGK